MRKFIIAGLVAVAGLASFAGDSQGCSFLHVPFVTVRINRGVGVFVAPGPVQVQVPARSTTELPGVVVSEQAPAVPADSLPPPTPLPGPVVVKPMTVEQFATAFQPKPGQYEVVLIHPKSCQPVKVCFALPDGCPRKVRWTRHVLEFDYGKCSVRIRFYLNGDVAVLY